MKEYHNDLRIHMLITRLPYIKLQYLFWNYNDMDARDIKKKIHVQVTVAIPCIYVSFLPQQLFTYFTTS